MKYLQLLLLRRGVEELLLAVTLAHQHHVAGRSIRGNHRLLLLLLLSLLRHVLLEVLHDVLQVLQVLREGERRGALLLLLLLPPRLPLLSARLPLKLRALPAKLANLREVGVERALLLPELVALRIALLDLLTDRGVDLLALLEQPRDITHHLLARLHQLRVRLALELLRLTQLLKLLLKVRDVVLHGAHLAGRAHVGLHRLVLRHHRLRLTQLRHLRHELLLLLQGHRARHHLDLDLTDLLLDLLLRVEAELLLHVVQLLALITALLLLSLDAAHERRALLLELVDLALVLIKLRADLIASLEVLLLPSRLRVDLVVDRLQLLLQSVDGGLRLLVVRIKSATIWLRNLLDSLLLLEQLLHLRRHRGLLRLLLLLSLNSLLGSHQSSPVTFKRNGN